MVYWGQNAREGKLADAYNTGCYEIVNIAFLYQFGCNRKAEINLAGHCDPNQCQRVSTSINHCQNKGIKVLLSIGGDRETYSLSSADDARTSKNTYGITSWVDNPTPDHSGTPS